ncbi:unnamed protein product [Effrenium voratum]|nr:unnamed protein product [Effrenium voratum]
MAQVANELDHKMQAELKATPKRSEEMEKVMSCVVRVVHEDMRHSHWASKAFDPKFIFELQEFNPDELKDDVMHLLDTHCSDPTLTAEKMESWKGPPIVRILNRWLHAVQCFGRVGAKLKPKLEELRRMHLDLEGLMREKTLIA